MTTQTTWASLVDVTQYTGVTVSTSQLAMAAAAIDIHARRTYDDASRIGARDQYWLKLAVCYQAAWMASQPDYFARMDVDSLGQGHSTTKFGPDAITVGPLARRALKNVSWLKSRSLHTQSSFTDGMGVLGSDPLSSAADAMYPWGPVEDGV